MKKFIDLFAGSGGLSLGFEQAGFTPIFANDINGICQKTYLHNHKNMSKENYFLGDINILNENIDNYKNKFKEVEVVCGGPPCQGFSMANRQRINDDPRNNLYKAYLMFLQKIRPPFFIMENVKGMLPHIDEILHDFNIYLNYEYSVGYSVLNAIDFGVPQNRERLVFIGNRLGINSNNIVSDIQRIKKKRYTLFDAIGDLPSLKPNKTKNKTYLENKDIGYSKRDFTYKRTNFYNFINNNTDVHFLFNHKNRYNNDRDIEIYSRLPQGCNSLDDSISDIMPYKSRAMIFKDKYFKLKYDEPCKTITAHMRFDCNMYIHPTQARGLSPREAARVQTFPDSYEFLGTPNNWYQQIGNAVPVKLAKEIGEYIAKCL